MGVTDLKNDDIFEGLDRRLNRSALIVASIAFPVVFFVFSVKAALSVAAGGVLSYINFSWLKQAIDFIVKQGAQGGGARGVAVRFVGRYALIGVFLYVTIRSSALQLGFVFAGLLLYVIAILIECFSEVIRVVIEDFRNGRSANNS
jgi:hypothetical protein